MPKYALCCWLAYVLFLGISCFFEFQHKSLLYVCDDQISVFGFYLIPICVVCHCIFSTTIVRDVEWPSRFSELCSREIQWERNFIFSSCNIGIVCHLGWSCCFLLADCSFHDKYENVMTPSLGIWMFITSLLILFCLGILLIILLTHLIQLIFCSSFCQECYAFCMCLPPEETLTPASSSSTSTSFLISTPTFEDSPVEAPYVSISSSSLLNAECCICTEPLGKFPVSWLPCFHVLHQHCYETFVFYNYTSCPLCRQPFSSPV